MVGYKQVICGLLLTTFSGLIEAQNNTNSPYTRYGFGVLSDQSFGNSKGMGGISLGLRDGSQINVSNPASYTAIDSLTFLFEGGITLQNTNFGDGNTKMNVKNSSFDYIAMQFRLNKHFAMSAGFLPFSNVGYNFGASESKADYTEYNTFTGEGGLNQIFAGLGYKIFENFSIGANASYLFGNIKHQSKTSFSDGSTNSAINSTTKVEEMSVRNYKLDFGAQYTQHFNKKHSATLGVIYSLKHSLSSDAYKYTGSTVTKVDTISNGFELPHLFGIGATYVYDKRLTVGFDYSFQKWSKARFYDTYNNLSDRSKYSIGAEYIPSFTNHNYFSRVKYRVGGYYSDPYAKINGQNGAREYGVSFGFGLPVFNSKSLLSITGQYVKITPIAKGMLDENYLKLSIGLTFNERWFMKWKVE